MKMYTNPFKSSPLSRLKSVCAISAIVLAAIVCKNVYAQQYATSGTNGMDYSSYLLQLVNEDRSEQGAPALEENPKLDHVAQVYADYLLRTGFFGHVDPFGRNPQDRAKLFGINTGVSENLAWESSNFEAPPTLIKKAEGSMMSEPRNQMNHRYNILNPSSRFIGLGVARGGDKVLIVQEFSSEQP